MFNFFAFIPCLTEIDPEEILINFRKKYEKEFEFSSMMNRSNGSVKCNIKFTSGYVNVWKEGYRKEHYESSHGIVPIARAFEAEHEIEIFSTGVCRISIQDIDMTDRENTKEEVGWHYYNIIEKLADEALLLEYTIAALGERPKGRSHQRIAETAFPSVFGEDYSLSQLADEMQRRIIMLAEKGMKHISVDIRAVLQDIQTLGSLLKRAGYEDLVRIHSKLSGLNRVNEMYEISSIRLIGNVPIQIDDLKKVREACVLFSKYIRYLEEQVRFALSLYSDYIGTAGVYASLIGVGAGIAFFSFGLENKIASQGVAATGLIIIITDIIFWLTQNTKGLITERLSTAIRNLQLAV